MEIYKLTNLGTMLAHNVNAEPTPKWKVIYFLNKYGAVDKDKILSSVQDATVYTLSELKRKGIITSWMGVNV